jgi:hypothetical protein
MMKLAPLVKGSEQKFFEMFNDLCYYEPFFIGTLTNGIKQLRKHSESLL